jgi:hypothetical protein
VLLPQWFSDIDSQWDVPPLAAFIRRLAAFGRVPGLWSFSDAETLLAG